MKRLGVLALVALVASDAGARSGHCRGRGGQRDCGDSGAFFEAFPANGAGTSGACSTTAPTGAKGEALTFTRASSATCTKTATGGLATTGIADGDLVVLSSNVARVEYDSNGVLGLLVEAAGTNVLLRSDALTNAAWSDVGTPTVTDGATDPFGGTTGDTIDDNDAAAFEGRSQSITVSSGAAYFMHCYVKAGTASKARISIDGTTQDISGLSSSTWSIVEKGDASSSSTSIAIQVLVGNAASDTGTVIWGGCDVKAGTYRTSLAPTAGVAVTRAADDRPYFNITSTAAGSLAASLWPLWSSAPANYRAVRADAAGSDATRFEIFVAGTTLNSYNEAGGVTTTALQAVSGLPTQARLAGWRTPSTTLAAIANSAQTTAATTVGALSVTRVYVGAYGGSTGFEANGIVSLVCLDPDPTRCR